MKDYSIDKCFNIYYLNLNKVYEISMMINNTIVTSIQREKNNSFKTSKSTKASLGGTIQTDSEYLASIKSVIESNKASENTSSSKIIESLDIKTTKSILLNKIKAKCINDKKINDLNEGDLIKIDNIQLSIFDKDTLRQILLLKRDALKGMKVEGLDINNIVNSIIKDYSYILIGQIENDNKNKIIIKIPFEIENEFENNYNVDDLLLGKISLIGIYKNKNKISDITNNTLNYFITNGGITKDIKNSKIIQSNIQTTENKAKKTNNDEYHYIDIIAIIQDINFKEEPKEKPLPWYRKILNFLKGQRNNEK